MLIMKVNKLLYIGLFFLVVLISCGKKSITSNEEYLSWMNDEANGLVMSKEVGGITIKVKYLPPNYLAYQDLSGQTIIKKQESDSIIKSYDKSLTFLMTIGVDGEVKKGDVMYQGIKDYAAYKERLYTMNFDIENDITIKIGGKKYHPVLSNLENGYGLTSSRNITLVFVPEAKEEKSFYTSEEIQFTYDDDLFDTGINHFTFNREDINNIPSFIFWN